MFSVIDSLSIVLNSTSSCIYIWRHLLSWLNYLIKKRNIHLTDEKKKNIEYKGLVIFYLYVHAHTYRFQSERQELGSDLCQCAQILHLDPYVNDPDIFTGMMLAIETLIESFYLFFLWQILSILNYCIQTSTWWVVVFSCATVVVLLWYSSLLVFLKIFYAFLITND